MRLLKISILIILSLSSISLNAQISDKLTINLADFIIQKGENGYDNIAWKTDYTTFEVGNPKLPVYRVTYVLPIDAKFTDVKFFLKKKELLKENLFIVPVQQLIPTNNIQKVVFTQPNNKIYELDSPYPNKLYEVESDETFQGYHILTLLIYPFEYIPKSRTLFYYSELSYTVNYIKEINSKEIKPLKQTLFRAEQCKGFIKSLVKNPENIEFFGSNVQSIWDGSKRKTESKNASSQQKTLQQIKSVSVLDEIPPDYIIITSDSLKTTFKVLADWKTKKGVFTIIKTVEEIANEYSGIDLQEKIRKYIIESYTHFGAGLYILLGGDINIIPARMVVGIDNILQAADMYYGSYNGNWNSDGDNFFNAPDYISQISLGIVLGRLPAKNTTEVSTMVNKVIYYEKAINMPETSYLRNNLYSDAYMAPNNPGPLTPLYIYNLEEIKEYVDSVPSNIQNKYICDNASCDVTKRVRYNTYDTICPGGDIELNKENFLSCLNTGANLGVGKFHFIYHMDHSGASSMGTSSIDKSQGITNLDMDNLTNGGSTQILMSGSCHPANFAEDCIAKHYLKKQNGGGVAFIGNTDSGYTNEHDQLEQFLKALYNKNTFNIGKTYLYVVKESNSSRYNKPWRLHLLGDPEMQVWTDVPQQLTVGVPPAILLGNQTDTVTLSNLPANVKAMICIQKGTEVYTTQQVIGTGDTLRIPINFTVNTPGDVNVTVTAHNFLPKEKTITANQTPAPNLYISTVDFGDGIVSGTGIGNGNGLNDAGETISLGLGIKNTGVNQANAVTATLNCNSSFIKIKSNQVSLGSLASGVTTTGVFSYKIDSLAPEKKANDTIPVQFSLSIKDVNNVIWKDTFDIDIFNSEIKQGNKSIVYISKNHTAISANDTVRFKIDLKNIGNAQATSIKATLTPNSTSANYISSCSATPRLYPTIGHFEVKQDSVPFQFVTSGSYQSGNENLLAFKLKVENPYGKVWNYDFDLSKPAKVTGLVEYSADTTEIDLKWNYSTAYSGYNVYRCNVDSATNNPIGNYVKVNTDSVTFSYYIDKNLGKLTKYLYKVAAISKTGNEGELSDSFLAWTSFPVKKFPLDFGAIRGGIIAVDINNDGYKEIFGATKGGYILGLDHNGKELYNIDGNVTTQGAYATLKTEVWGTPAVGDLHSNGQKQLIGANRNYSPFKVYCFSSNSTNSSIPDTLWTKKILSGNMSGVILSNIDNSADGSLEVIVACENGDILIYNANGNLLNTIHSAGSLGAVAVADLTGSGTKEIIKAVGNSIYIWGNDGNPYKGINGAYCSISSGAFTFNNQSVIVCDIDNDGKKEIIVTAVSGATGKIYAIRTDFPDSIVTNWNTPEIKTYGSISVGDLNHDGILEIAALGSNTLNVLNNKGILLDSIHVEGLNPVGNPIIADIDGNSDNEIIFGSSLGTNQNLFGYSMDFVHNDIKKVLGFPLKTHATAFSIPCVSDINNDGKNELIAGVDNWIYIWKTNGKAGNVEWGCDWQNEHNTSEYTKNCNLVSLESSETWSSDHDFCGDLIVKSGTLTINNGSNLKMGNSTTITVMSGASLVIDGASVLNANVRALAGSTLTIKNNGSIKLRSNAEFYTETGTNLEIQYGSVDKQ